MKAPVFVPEHKRFLFAGGLSGVLLLSMLLSCNTVGSAPPPVTLTENTPASISTDVTMPSSPELSLLRQTVQQLFEVAGQYLTATDTEESIQLGCTVNEGPQCWFAGEDLNNSNTISRELAKEIVTEIGPQEMDHMKAQSIVIRCSRPKNSPDTFDCEFDGGGGWTKLFVQ